MLAKFDFVFFYINIIMAALIIRMWPATHIRPRYPAYRKLWDIRQRVEDARFGIYELAKMVKRNNYTPILFVESTKRTWTVDADFPTREVIVTKRSHMKIISIKRYRYDDIEYEQANEIEDVYKGFFNDGTYCKKRSSNNNYKETLQYHDKLLRLMRAKDNN